MVFRGVLIAALFACIPALLFAQLTEQEYMKMSELLLKDYSIEEHQAIQERTELYFKNNRPKPLQRFAHRTFSPVIPKGFKKASASGYTRLLVIVDQDLYANATAKTKIDRYVEDIGKGYGCPIEVEVIDGGTDAEIKTLIKGYYTDGGLDGAVLVGHITGAFYYIPNDHYWWEDGYGPVTFPIDLYYMDLDGTWTDANNDGKWEDHQPGSGDKSPEIFVGRIDPYTMRYFGTEVELLGTYMDKNHAYWTRGITLSNTALSYCDHDWASSNIGMDATYGTSNVEVLRWTSSNNVVSRNDYLNNRLTKDYTIIFMWCHASYRSHGFHEGGSLDLATIYNANPKPNGYNIDGCSSANWSAGNDRFLCGAYVYNESPTALSLISTTKTGGMLGHRPFYESLGENNCHGQAFMDWIDNMIRTYRGDYGYVIGWHYGMTIVGDPMIAFKDIPVSIVPDTPSGKKGGHSIAYNNGNARNGNARVSYSLDRGTTVILNIYTVQGKLAHTCFSGYQAQGSYAITINKDRFSKGLYILDLKTPNQKMAKRISIY